MIDQNHDGSRLSLVLLSAIMEKIATEYGKRGLSSVDLGDRQYYHAVPSDEMFNMANTPSELIIGDLEDDYNELKRLINDDMPTAVDMERLGRLLIAASEAILE